VELKGWAAVIVSRSLRAPGNKILAVRTVNRCIRILTKMWEMRMDFRFRVARAGRNAQASLVLGVNATTVNQFTVQWKSLWRRTLGWIKPKPAQAGQPAQAGEDELWQLNRLGKLQGEVSFYECHYCLLVCVTRAIGWACDKQAGAMKLLGVIAPSLNRVREQRTTNSDQRECNE